MPHKTEFHPAGKREQSISLERPRLFKVIMHNDDITTMDFVVDVLVTIFHKAQADAAAIMMDVHDKGTGVAGVYTYDIAVTKKMQTDRMANDRRFPLKLTLEEAPE